MTKQALLLVVLGILTTLVLVGCNGADLESPTANPLPGSGTDNPLNLDEIDANYALDLFMPQREIPSIPIDDPKWEPVFDSLTDDLTCIDEGCISFDLVDFNTETNIVTFDATFFNFNADNAQDLTIFLLYTDPALGVVPYEHDGLMKIEQFDVVVYPFVAFNHDENSVDNIPDELYLYFEREISFKLDVGSDFYVGFTLIAMQDINSLTHLIDSPEPVFNDDEQDGDSRNGDGSVGNESCGTPDSSGNNDQGDDEEDNSTSVGAPNGNPPLKRP